jgi:hypothetical protein
VLRRKETGGMKKARKEELRKRKEGKRIEKEK